MHRRDFITSSTLATLALALPAFADTVPPKPMRLLVPGDKTESRSGKVAADGAVRMAGRRQAAAP